MLPEEANKFIDIDKIFKEKSPGIYKWMPKFLINYVKKITHQDEINAFQATHKDVYELEYLNAVLKMLGPKISVTGLENIPTTGSIILASNHPLGGLDGLSFIQQIAVKRTDIKFIVNDILIHLKNFGSLFVGVNKIGSTNTKGLNAVEEAYASDEAVLIFPAGLVSRQGKNGKIEDLPWSKGFVTRAIKYQTPIIPVHIDGRLSNFFYRLYRFRKFIGIKANIEMLYLADEMFKQKNHQIKITIGKPIAPENLKHLKKPQLICNRIKALVYELPKNPNIDSNNYVLTA